MIIKHKNTLYDVYVMDFFFTKSTKTSIYLQFDLINNPANIDPLSHNQLTIIQNP